MDKAYNEIVFHNDQSPDLDEINMNAISHGLATVDDRVIALKGDLTVIQEEFFYKISFDNIEQGSWSNNRKDSGTRRIRNANRIPVKAGNIIHYAPNGLYINYNIYASEESQTSIEDAGWFGGETNVSLTRTIMHDGFMCMQFANGKSYATSTDITPSNYVANIYIEGGVLNNINNDINYLQADVNGLTDNIEYSINPKKIEQGSWAGNNKVGSLTRIRYSQRVNVREGDILYYNAHMHYININIYADETSAQPLLDTGWFGGNDILNNLYIKYDGVMCLTFANGKGASATNITPSDYVCDLFLLRETINRTSPSESNYNHTADFAARERIDTLHEGDVFNRIPLITLTRLGSMIIGADAREYSSDQAPTDIKITRKAANSDTFSPAVTVLHRPRSDKRVNDGTIVLTKNNKIIVFGHSQNTLTRWEDVYERNSPERVNFDFVYSYSNDDGVSWSPQQSLKYLYEEDSDIVTLFGGVGSGIVMNNGTIVVPCQASMCTASATGEVSPVTGRTMYSTQSCFIWSKDEGATWHLSDFVPCQSSECNVVEYRDNQLIINCRSVDNARKIYKCEYKAGGFTSWEPHISNRTLIEPNCQGTATKIKLGYRSVGLFLNPHDLSIRKNITLQATKDYIHYYPITNLYAGTCEGYTGIASNEDVIYAVFENAGYIYLVDLHRYVPAIFGL